MTLTNEKYVEKEGTVCPNCGSCDISLGLTTRILCGDCDSGWNEEWEGDILTGYSDLKLGDSN
jgi:ribosomal protein S27AE